MKHIWKLLVVVAVLLLVNVASAQSSTNKVYAKVGLAWDPSPSTNVVGYNIYHGVASRTYTNVINAANNLTCTVSNLVRGTTYYFAATAYDNWGLESDYSEELSYTVPLPPVPPENLRVVESTP